MTLRDQLLVLSDAYCAGGPIGRKRLSTLIFNDGKKLDAIASGRDLTTVSFETAMRWLSENWPDGLAWPDGIARPGIACERQAAR